MFIFVYAFAAQWGIGAIINIWPMAPNGQFAAEGYGRAFLVMLGIQLVIVRLVAGLAPDLADARGYSAASGSGAGSASESGAGWGYFPLM